MRLLAVIISYYPEKELLIRDFKSFENQVDKIIIWENTPELEREKFRYIVSPKVEYVAANSDSISAGLNYAWQYAVNYGYDYILTMDQDSEFLNFNVYLNLTILSETSPKGIYQPRLNNCPSCDKEYSVAFRTYTSGTLIATEILNKIKGYREDFLIDAIDFELCTRARLYDIPTYVVNSAVMMHHFGELHKIKYLGLSTYNYSPMRLYGILRNHMIVLREYKNIPFIVRYTTIKNFFVIMPFKVLLFENNGLRKFINCYKGLIDGLKYKK